MRLRGPGFRPGIGEHGQAGAEGVMLGRTEIELLVSSADSPVRVFPPLA